MPGAINIRHKLNKGSYQVLKALEEIGKLSSAQDINLWFRNNDSEDAPALTTIYRAIDSLLKERLIQAVDIGDGEKRYETVRPGEHHHHLICTTCLDSIHLDQCLIDAMTGNIENRHGFTVQSHVLEIFGTCNQCIITGNSAQTAPKYGR